MDNILNGYSREDYARERKLFPSQYPSLFEEDKRLAGAVERVSMLNAIFDGPCGWPEGEVSALANYIGASHGATWLKSKVADVSDEMARELKVRGLEVDNLEAAALSEMMSDGTLFAKADLKTMQYDLLAPAENERLPIATSFARFDNWAEAGESMEDGALTPIRELESEVEEVILSYLPETDRFVLEERYSNSATTYRQGDDAAVERLIHRDEEERVVSKEEAYELLTDGTGMTHTASPEASTIIQKLLDEIEGACDLSTLSEQTSLASSNIEQSHEPVEVEGQLR